MADVSKISLYGTNYNIKDSSARSSATSASNEAKSAAQTAATAKTTADSALSNSETNKTNISKIASSSIAVTYTAEKETIEITQGIPL